jgi:hypothetical protein
MLAFDPPFHMYHQVAPSFLMLGCAGLMLGCAGPNGRSRIVSCVRIAISARGTQGEPEGMSFKEFQQPFAAVGEGVFRPFEVVLKAGDRSTRQGDESVFVGDPGAGVIIG